MKRVVIVHCWDGFPNYCWYPKAAKELEKRGFQVEVPAMPDTAHPNMDTWVPALEKIVGTPDEELFLVGHSIGCATIMRYLEKLPAGQQVGGMVLVAGFTDNLGFDELTNFYRTPLNFKSIRSHIKNGSVIINSDDDQYVDLKYGEQLAKEFSAKYVVKQNMGHFSGEVDNESSCTELPDVVTAIEELSYGAV